MAGLGALGWVRGWFRGLKGNHIRDGETWATRIPLRAAAAWAAVLPRVSAPAIVKPAAESGGSEYSAGLGSGLGMHSSLNVTLLSGSHPSPRGCFGLQQVDL